MSVSRVLLVGTTALAAIGMVAACSSGGSPAGTGPSSAASTAASAGSPGGNSGAPHVSAPLNVDRINANPCDALSADQIDRLGMVGPGRPSRDSIGTMCQWTSASYKTNTMSISLITANDLGLGNIYNKKSEQAYFEPTTIDGYPAVYASQPDDRSTGDCVLAVGLTDQRMVLVQAQLGDGLNRSNPCPVNERTAKAMIEHLKGAA
ncbi:DUF3558 domain-containing protein [Amycolatopsis pigmentata]|uniref:DUF3558 domain-containing protein n=1 Tax=Amycolatopsis pigmentata TaxID=450801 RepID=A0ABW5FVH4_9PSEU